MRRVRVHRGWGDLLETEALEPYERRGRRSIRSCPFRRNEDLCPCEWENDKCLTRNTPTKTSRTRARGDLWSQ
jgi:hypothetical protein